MPENAFSLYLVFQTEEESRQDVAVFLLFFFMPFLGVYIAFWLGGELIVLVEVFQRPVIIKNRCLTVEKVVLVNGGFFAIGHFVVLVDVGDVPMPHDQMIISSVAVVYGDDRVLGVIPDVLQEQRERNTQSFSEITDSGSIFDGRTHTFMVVP